MKAEVNRLIHVRLEKWPFKWMWWLMHAFRIFFYFDV